MKFYGRKGSAFGQAYKDPERRHQSDFYDAMVRAGRKRERQAAKKECQAGIDDYEYFLSDYWIWYDGDEYGYDFSYGEDDYTKEDYEQHDFEGWYDECY